MTPSNPQKAQELTSSPTADEAHDSEPAILFAKQPILDADLNLAAYELLFRGDFDAVSGEEATATVFFNAFTINQFLNSESIPFFVNFTKDLLFQVPPFSKDSFVVELLEDVEPTAAVVSQVELLKSQGYTIALDDYIDSDAMIPLLYLADIVKIDLMATTLEEIATLAPKLRRYDVKLLAEKVETHEEYEYCKNLNFEYYQGYFFARPAMVPGKVVGPNVTAVLTMIAALQDPDIDHETLESIILSDSGLTYKILKLANSAELRRAESIDSIRHAIAMLGFRRVSNFASLMALSNLGNKPAELQVYAKFRSLLCERLGEAAQSDAGANVFETVGLLSCCPAYFDLELPELVDSLPLSAEVKDALLSRSGELGLVLDTAQQLQEATWDDINWTGLDAIGLSKTVVTEIYRETSAWDNSSRDVEIW